MIQELKIISNIIINAFNKTLKISNAPKLSVLNTNSTMLALIVTKPTTYQNHNHQNHYQNHYQLALPKTFQDVLMPLKVLSKFATKLLNLLMDHTILNSIIALNLNQTFPKLITALFVIVNK